MPKPAFLLLLLLPVYSQSNSPCYKVCRALSPSSACASLCTCYWGTQSTGLDSDENFSHAHRRTGKDSDDVSPTTEEVQTLESAGLGGQWQKCREMCAFGQGCDFVCTVYSNIVSFPSLLPISVLLSICLWFLSKRSKGDSAVDPSPLLAGRLYP